LVCFVGDKEKLSVSLCVFRAPLPVMKMLHYIFRAPGLRLDFLFEIKIASSMFLFFTSELTEKSKYFQCGFGRRFK
jgi:hypothetical protein